MAASDHLSTGLFHGTNVKLNVGDIIQPSTKAGHTPFAGIYASKRGQGEDPAHSRGDHVFMHPDEHEAWNWADHNTEEGTAASDKHPQSYASRSPRVYEVEPIGGDHRPSDVNLPGGEMIMGERVTQRGQGARVVREHIIPKPGQEKWNDRRGTYEMQDHVQGQIPDVNWGAQDAKDYRNSFDRKQTLRKAQAQTGVHRAEEHARANPPWWDLSGYRDPNQGELFNGSSYDDLRTRK